MNEEHFTFNLQYKHSSTFANRKYEELSYPENHQIGDPILVTLLKLQPYHSQSNRENVTPSSGTSPLASYKEVPRRARNPTSIPLEAVMMPFFQGKAAMAGLPYLALTGMCHLIGYSFQSQCSVLNRCLSIELGT